MSSITKVSLLCFVVALLFGGQQVRAAETRQGRFYYAPSAVQGKGVAIGPEEKVYVLISRFTDGGGQISGNGWLVYNTDGELISVFWSGAWLADISIVDDRIYAPSEGLRVMKLSEEVAWQAQHYVDPYGWTSASAAPDGHREGGGRFAEGTDLHARARRVHLARHGAVLRREAHGPADPAVARAGSP